MSFEKLTIGNLYSKSELSEIFDNPNIKLVQEGIYNLNSTQTFFFVDLEKKGKLDRFHFDDFFERDFFHWDSQTTQHINSPKIKEIIGGIRVPYLFVRVVAKIKSKTQPFVYCGRLKYVEYEEGTSKPIHIIFQNLDYQVDTDNLDLISVYSWKPGKIGKSTKSAISKRDVVSEEMKRTYIKPNKTERSGFVTSRVGQGYYRQEVKFKWDNSCPVTGCTLVNVLISSHIVPWAECNDEERLDVENSILLSPNVDALFDSHLISFTDEGDLIISEKISPNDLEKLGIPIEAKIPISEGMRPYLKKHRKRMYESKK